MCERGSLGIHALESAFILWLPGDSFPRLRFAEVNFRKYFREEVVSGAQPGRRLLARRLLGGYFIGAFRDRSDSPLPLTVLGTSAESSAWGRSELGCLAWFPSWNTARLRSVRPCGLYRHIGG